MEAKATAKRSIWIFAGTLLAWLFGELTGDTLFFWVWVVMSGWLFLHLYWLLLCGVHYFSRHDGLPSIEEVDIFGETDPQRPHEPELSMTSSLAQNMRRTLSE